MEKENIKNINKIFIKNFNKKVHHPDKYNNFINDTK